MLAAVCREDLISTRGCTLSANAITFLAPLSQQRNFNALVAFTFAANFHHSDAADLTDVADVRAAARLQIDSCNLEQSYSAGPSRGLDAHRLDQLRSRIQFLVSDPYGLRFDAACDQLVGFALDLGGVQQAHIDVEVEPTFVG
jgi:hypothetical protein